MRLNIICREIAWAAVAAALIPAGSQAQSPSAEEIIKKMHQAFFYQGQTFSARVKMILMTADAKERLRDLSMLRVNMPKKTDQRYFMYFHAPGDVRGMSFLVYKYPAQDDDL